MMRIQRFIIHRSKNTIVSNKHANLTENPDLEADFKRQNPR